MEQKLKRLFDYQKFQNNPRLEAMLQEAEGRYAGSLSDDDLELVSAAGEPINPVLNDQVIISAPGEFEG